MKIRMLVIVSMLFPPLCSAGGWFTKNAEVESIQTESDFVLVKLVGSDLTLSDGCDTPTDVILKDETKTGDRQLSMLLAAQASGKRVAIYTIGCIDKWDKKYPKIWSVKIQ